MNKRKLLLFVGIAFLNAGFSLDGALYFKHGNIKGEVLPEIAGRKLAIWHEKDGANTVQATVAGEDLVFLASLSQVIRNTLLNPEWAPGSIHALKVKNSFENVHYLLQQTAKDKYFSVEKFKAVKTEDIIEASLCAQELEMSDDVSKYIHQICIDRIANEPSSATHILGCLPKQIATAMRYITELPTNDSAHKTVFSCNSQNSKVDLITADPEKDLFAAASLDEIKIYDLEQNNLITDIKIKLFHTATACAISSKHQKVIVASKFLKSDAKSTIECFQLKTGNRLWETAIKTDICKIVISEEDDAISLVSKDTITVLDAKNGTYRKTEKHMVNPEHFQVNANPDAIKLNRSFLSEKIPMAAIDTQENFIISLLADKKEINIRDIKTGVYIRELSCENNIASIAISASGAIIAGDNVGKCTVFKSQKLINMPKITPWYKRRTTLLGATFLGAAALTAYSYRASLVPLWGRITSLFSRPTAQY